MTKPEQAADDEPKHVIEINGRVLRDFYCEICIPAVKGTRATVTWHDASTRCELEGAIHCRCKPCASIAP